MAHGMSDKEQRRRIINLVREKEGVDCPELVVDWIEPLLDGGQVEYRCSKSTPLQHLDLTPQEARHVGMDIDPPESPEAGGY